MYTMYSVSCSSLGLPLKLFHYDLITLMCTGIPPSPDNFKRLIKYQTFQTTFIMALNQLQTLYSPLGLILGRSLFKVIRL